MTTSNQQNNMATTCQNYKNGGDGNNVISGNSSRPQPMRPNQPTNTPSTFEGVVSNIGGVIGLTHKLKWDLESFIL